MWDLELRSALAFALASWALAGLGWVEGPTNNTKGYKDRSARSLASAAFTGRAGGIGIPRCVSVQVLHGAALVCFWEFWRGGWEGYTWAGRWMVPTD